MVSRIINTRALCVIVAVFFMMGIATPHVHTLPAASHFSAVSILLFALPCYAGIVHTFGIKRGLIAIFFFQIFALMLENIAIKTGFPYGDFSYGASLGQYIGAVPWTVGFAWSPIFFSAVALIENSGIPTTRFVKMVLVATLMTCVDIVLDPSAVQLGFWSWQSTQTGLYGVPWTNFAGWILTSSLAAWLLQRFFPIKKINWHIGTLLTGLCILSFWTGAAITLSLGVSALVGLGVLCILCIQESRWNHAH